MIAVIDYGAGNLRSIVNACKYLGKRVELISNPEELGSAEKIILPGVGNFGNAMNQMNKFGRELKNKISDGVPFLGICLGIQVIFDESDEDPSANGLGILRGKCTRFPNCVKVPHIGWNSIEIIRECPILNGIESGSYVYFVHSYYVIPEDKKVVVAITRYGVEFPSIIHRDNIFAVQFHPEKSGEVGLRILKNFLDL
ncbi:MAG TPA: imidazole glycerol phosphate synthase subunit HisH [Candidatus Altiarchaeales archaeon]|nr:imidazole glycerol phosphate synthase subunit HisH [Candidatus Altiarchaeales archaeon]HEX54708.1 imidazole glycerol phosphate synthase subunit HisH [Candidatus Altiarchaeales archaeon]